MLSGQSGARFFNSKMLSNAILDIKFKPTNCKALAEQMTNNVRERINELKSVKPRLDVLRTSKRTDSDSYIRIKKRVLEGTGIEFKEHDISLLDRTSVIALLNSLNLDPSVHGILVQFPLGDHLSKHFRNDELMEMIDWKKDVDGFNPINMIHSISKCGSSSGGYLESCTPKAVMRLLKEMQIDLRGRDVVLVGKSRVVGLPLLHQLLSAGATVQTCHKQTVNLPQKCRQAEILISAAGSANLITESCVRPGAVVIDIGINYDEEGRLIGGDVDYDAVKSVAAYVTPVPGGIGPLTVASLAENVLKAVLLSHQNKLI